MESIKEHECATQKTHIVTSLVFRLLFVFLFLFFNITRVLMVECLSVINCHHWVQVEETINFRNLKSYTAIMKNVRTPHFDDGPLWFFTPWSPLTISTYASEPSTTKENLKLYLRLYKYSEVLLITKRFDFNSFLCRVLVVASLTLSIAFPLVSALLDQCLWN